MNFNGWLHFVEYADANGVDKTPLELLVHSLTADERDQVGGQVVNLLRAGSTPSEALAAAPAAL